LRRSPPCAATDSTNRVSPPNQRLPLTKADPRSLRRPCLTVDELGCRPAQVSGEAFELPFDIPE
jgi:hypothetical protein